jgi:nucleotide-binding universal stress UspA family protein
MGRIVVGIDGSWASKAVLRFAVEEARLRGSSLHVVHAWRYSTGGLHTFYTGGLGTQLGGPAMTRAEQEQRRLERFVGKLLPATDVEITVSAVEGFPAQALLEAAKGAELLVVGSRGHGGFGGLLLGSVSQQCAHHAPCPMVIVRPLGKPRRLMWPEV